MDMTELLGLIFAIDSQNKQLMRETWTFVLQHLTMSCNSERRNQFNPGHLGLIEMDKQKSAKVFADRVITQRSSLMTKQINGKTQRILNQIRSLESGIKLSQQTITSKIRGYSYSFMILRFLTYSLLLANFHMIRLLRILV